MNYRQTLLVALAFLPLVLLATLAPASASGSGLPWEGPLGKLGDALQGPTAKYISIIAIFIAGLGLIFGEDLGGFAKKMLMIVIAAAFLLGASSFLTNLTPQGAVI